MYHVIWMVKCKILCKKNICASLIRHILNQIRHYGCVQPTSLIVEVFVGHELYLVVLSAALVLVQSDALPVQDPVMTFPLRKQKTEKIHHLWK